MNVKLGGRDFAAAELDRMTFEQSHYLMHHVRVSGLDQIWPTDDESDEAYDARLRSAVIQAGNVPQVLAGYLVPEGVRWSPAIARQTAEHLSGLTDQEDHRLVLALAAQVAPDFFVRALDWFGISQLSLNGAQPAKPQLTPVH